MIFLHEAGELLFRYRPQYTGFHKLYVFYGRLQGDEAVKGSKKVRCQRKPMSHLPAFKVVEATNSTLLKEVEVPAGFPFPYKYV
jgi:hypothetical protein